MPDIAAIIAAGAAHPWIYLPAAILLGALHALEPGHSKSLMAAFIVAVRGTPAQAVILGVSAAVGHTIVVWGLALLGLYLGDALILDRVEPWLVLATGILVMLLALRIFRMTMPVARHAHDHGHDHGHQDDHGHQHDHADDRPGLHDLGIHRQDAHAAAHGREIDEKYAGRSVGTFDIIWFGFTGGLLPCPSALAVLLICLQLGAFTLGVAMVAAFSLGLAVTLVGVGLVAAWGTRVASARWSGFERAAAWLPYASAGLVLIMGVAVTLSGLWQLGALPGSG